jgi:hypothetical protein
MLRWIPPFYGKLSRPDWAGHKPILSRASARSFSGSINITRALKAHDFESHLLRGNDEHPECVYIPLLRSRKYTSKSRLPEPFEKKLVTIPTPGLPNFCTAGTASFPFSKLPAAKVLGRSLLETRERQAREGC